MGDSSAGYTRGATASDAQDMLADVLRHPRLIVALVTSLLAAPIAACSLFTDFSGLSGGGAIQGEAGTVDANASVDATTIDGQSTKPDGAVAAEAGAPFCKGVTGATFCADFDEGILAEAWSVKQIDPKGAIELSPSHAVSQPSSFHATLPRRAKDDVESVYLREDISGPWTRTVVDFDLFIEKPSWQMGDVNVSIVEIDFVGDTVTRSLGLPIGDGYMQIYQDGLVIDGGAPIFDTQFHIQIDVEPATNTVRANINGQSYTATTPTAFVGSGTQTLVAFGVLGYNTPCAGFSIYYDNIVIARQ